MSDIPLPRTIAVIQEGMAAGLHVGAQVYISMNGSVVADLAFGQARPGVAMTPQTLMLWLSSTKPVAAVAIGQLWERGKLELDDPVVRHIPEFAAGGKEKITLGHLLAHTAGIRGAVLGWTGEPWDTVISRICASRIETGWEPGKKAGYHIASSWFILGEIVRRVDGRPFEQYVREAIFLPIGMENSWIGMPPERYRAYGDRIGLMHDMTGARPLPNLPDDTEAGCALCRPGSNGRGPARELGFFYEALLAGGQRNGGRILLPQTIQAPTKRHRGALLDHTFRHVMDWGLGFMVNNNLYGADTVPYSFGRFASAQAFGHGGSQSSVGWADPAFGLAGAILFNGRPGEEKHNQRVRQATSAVYEDLKLMTQ